MQGVHWVRHGGEAGEGPSDWQVICGRDEWTLDHRVVLKTVAVVEMRRRGLEQCQHGKSPSPTSKLQG